MFVFVGDNEFRLKVTHHSSIRAFLVFLESNDSVCIWHFYWLSLTNKGLPTNTLNRHRAHTAVLFCARAIIKTVNNLIWLNRPILWTVCGWQRINQSKLLCQNQNRMNINFSRQLRIFYLNFDSNLFTPLLLRVLDFPFSFTSSARPGRCKWQFRVCVCFNGSVDHQVEWLAERT